MKGKDNMSHKTLFLQQSYEDCTRQYMELLEKQKRGKKRMRQIGNVEMPQEAFLSVLKLDDE